MLPTGPTTGGNGVRFVTLNSFLTVFDQLSWDIHGSKPFMSIKQMAEIIAPMYDQGYSALIEDLHERGLLDNTLVTTLSEFGRTPKMNPAGGRDHWPQCFTCSFAGGGVKGGRVVGKSEPVGGFPAEVLLAVEVLGARQGRSVYGSIPLQFGFILPPLQHVERLERIPQPEAECGKRLGLIHNLNTVQGGFGCDDGRLLGGRQPDDEVSERIPYP